MPPQITIEERLRRVAVRHCLAPDARTETPEDAARAVVCLHGTDSSSVYLSAWARMQRPSVAAVDDALYDRRALLRMLAMRRTVFVVPTEDAPIVQTAGASGVARLERRRTEAMVGAARRAGRGDMAG